MRKPGLRWMGWVRPWLLLALWLIVLLLIVLWLLVLWLLVLWLIAAQGRLAGPWPLCLPAAA